MIDFDSFIQSQSATETIFSMENWNVISIRQISIVEKYKTALFR